MIGRNIKSPIPSYQQGFATHELSAAPDLWKGVIFAISPALGPTGSGIFDWSNRKTKLPTSGTSWITDPNGRVLRFAGGGGVTIDAINNVFDETKGTIGMWANADNWQQAGSHFVININSIALNSNIGILTVGATNLRWRHRGAGTTVRVLKDMTGITGEHFLSMTWDVAADELKGFFDGKQEAATMNSLGAWGVGDPDTSRLGQFNSSFFLTGNIGNCVVWNRVLTEREHQFLYLHRHIMFQPAIHKQLVPFVLPGRLSRYHPLNGLGGQGQMTWNPLG